MPAQAGIQYVALDSSLRWNDKREDYLIRKQDWIATIARQSRNDEIR